MNDSINKNGASVCMVDGTENYEPFTPAHRKGEVFYQYDYRHDGELFSTVAPTLEKCRERRDEWLNRKTVTQ